MTDPGFSVHIVDTRTGNIVLPELPFLDTPEFTRQLNDGGSIQVRIPLGDASCPPAEKLRQLVAPWRFSLAIAIGPTILAYGPIITHQLDHSNQILSVGAASMWAILGRRIMMATGATLASPLSMDADQDVVIGPLSLHTIAKRIVSGSLARGASYALPIDYPDDIAGIHERNYPIYDMATVEQRLKDLTQVEDGPDIDWDPYFSDSQTVRVRMRIGNPELTQTGLDLLWDDTSSITYINVDSNASQMSTAVFTRGNATERASQIAYAADGSLITVGWPPLEQKDDSHQSVTDFTTLQSHADEWIRFYSSPVEIWQTEVICDMSPVVGTYRPGDHGSLNVQSHPWIPPGLYFQRLIGWQNAGPNRLRLILEAREGAV